MKTSSRHHYIPKYLINGFTNDQKMVYVYDKRKREILSKPKPPKSIFFEWDRNTLNLPNDIESSILEETLYRDIDNIGSEIVQYYQNTELKDANFSDDRSTQFLFFLISLFWRIPYTDYAVSNLVKQFKIYINSIDAEGLINSDDFKKMHRSRIMSHMIREIQKEPEGLSKFVNLHQIPDNILVLGDNPLLHKERSNKFSDFAQTDFMIALSSNRIYTSTTESGIRISNYNAVAYNTAVIEQAVRYVCSEHLSVLQKSINMYEEICKMGLNYELAIRAFKDEYNYSP
jgi:hypothetical protein